MNPSIGRKTLLLTGAAGRLGTALIELIGDELDIIALVNKQSLDAATRNIKAFDMQKGRHRSAPVRTICCDLTCEEELRTTIRTITALTSNIHYVVNAAGDLRFLGSSVDTHLFLTAARRQFDLNVIAPLLICSILFHEQWKHVPVKDQDVSIINVSSISGSKPYFDQGQGIYAATKAATNMLTLHMSSDFGKYGIKVNAVCPGSFPSYVSTWTVAESVMRGLYGQASGQLYIV